MDVLLFNLSGYLCPSNRGRPTDARYGVGETEGLWLGNLHLCPLKTPFLAVLLALLQKPQELLSRLIEVFNRPAAFKHLAHLIHNVSLVTDLS
jgi:hypothetical protein